MTSEHDDLIKLIKEKAEENKLSCIEAQELAEQVGLPLLEVGKAADKLEIKIIDCQLGCF